MIFEELIRIKDRDRHPTPQNPHAKLKPRRLRRAEARQRRLETKNLDAAANKTLVLPTPQKNSLELF